VKRTAILAAFATASMAQVPMHTATVAAPAAAPAPAPAAFAAAPAAEANGDAAPLAPLSSTLLQGHPAAPTGIDDVLLVPSASAGQKAVGFQYYAPGAGEGYVIWKNIFAAAQYTAATAATDAQTIASFGVALPSFGAGLSIATRDTTNESAADVKATTTRALTQLKLFGSLPLGRNTDGYFSIGRFLQEDYLVTDNGSTTIRGVPRHERYLLQAGMRKYPATGAEGLGWNVVTTDGFDYDRAFAGQKNDMVLLANVLGQVGYAFVTDGVNFFPGVDVALNYSNGNGVTGAYTHPDYALAFDLSPYAALLVPMSEHVTFKGGARYTFEQTLVDNAKGDPSVFTDHQLIGGLTGNVGLRYEYKRGAIEAMVGNGIVGGTGGFFASVALTANLK